MRPMHVEREYVAKKKVTRRDRFLGEINTVTPWSALMAQGGGKRFLPKRKDVGARRLAINVFFV